MEEQNLDLSKRAEFIRPATTDLESFLPFGGENLQSDKQLFTNNPQSVPVTIENKRIPDQTSTLPQFLVKDNVTGFDPFSNNEIAKNPKDFSNALAAKLSKDLANLDSREHYSKTHMYDSSPTGAHKARYKAYGQSTYDKIGFNPEVNNEDLFNANTSIFDDYVRMATNSAFPMFVQGLFANPKSYSQIFQGNIGQDIDESEKYEEWNAIGYSSKGGLGAFFNNAINSVSYSAGIMFEAAAEYAAVGAIEGSIVGPEGTAVGAAAGGLVGAVKGLTAVPKALFDMGKYGGKMLTNLKNLEKFTEAKALFNTASKTTLNFVNPLNNTFQGIKAAKTGDNLTALARTAKTAGGFFRDVIGMNMALSEGRLEGGFVENNTYQKLYDEYWKREGKAPDIDTQVRMKKTAKIAGTQDTYKNAALVFYSNKLAFENLTSGKFMAGASGKVSQVGKEFDIIYKAAKEKGEQGVYELVDYNFKNGLKGIIQPKNFGKATLNYFKTNLVEGAQEVMQDVIAKATEDYYVGAFYDKSKANNDYSFATLDNAFAKQVSAEGFETFASGFVMGGLLRPFGGAIPRYAGVLYNKYMMDPAEYQEYIDNRKNYGQAVVNAMNNMQKANPAKLLKQRYVNLGVQSKINTILADEDASIKEKNDAIDASFLSDVLTTLKAGTFKTWLYNYEKMNEMSDKDFEETYNLKEGDGIKLKENLKEYISRAKKLQARYNYGRDEFGDKRLNLQNFQEGTPEYDKASIYNEALDTAVFNLTFLSETFDLNLQRVNKITQTLSKSKLFGRLPGSDIQNILEPNRLDSVINSLSEEINILKNTEDQYVLNTKIQNQIDEKETLLKKLTAFQETQIKWFQMEEINKIFETIKDESRKNGSSEAEAEAIAIEEIKNAYFQDDSIESADKKHFDAFNDLLIELAGSELNYTMGMREMGRNINSNTLYNYLKDIYLLTQENKNIVPYINLLTNRAGFYEHVEKNFQWMRNLWLNKQNYYKDIVNQSIKMKENNALLKSLADDNIFVDLDEFAEWVENPDILPSYFIDASQGAEKIIPKGSFLYDKYIEIFERVARMQQMAATEDSVDLDGQLQEAIDDLMNKKNNEIEAATVSFKSSIQQETGFSYADLEKKQNEINQNKIQKQNKNNESQIKQIKSFLESIKINDPNKVIDLIVEFRGSNILPYDNFNEDIIQDFINGITDKEYVTKNVIPYVNQYPESYGESRFIAGFRRFAVEQILNNYIKDLSEEEMEIVEDLTDPIKETQSWNDYQKALKKIEDKYEKLLEELVSEFTARGLSTKTKEEEDFVPVTTTTPWSEIENNHPELFKILESKFRDDVIIKMGISESNVNFEQIRNNWLEAQSEIINKYNADIAAKNFIKKEKEKQFTPPNLKHYKFPKSFGSITEKTKIEPLVVVRDSLNSMLITGIKIDKNGNQTKLKKQTLDKIENDVNELNRVISWLRTYGEKPNFEKFQKYIDIFNTRIRNRKAEIEEVRDENGRLIERRIDGKTVKNRVTKEAEALAIEMTPGKKPFLYYALKPSKENIKDSEGNIVDTVERPPEIQTLYDSIMEDDSISSEDKLDNFLLAFKNFILRSKVNIWKNANNTKINKEKFELLEESLKQDFSKENVVKSIQELAYKHRTDAGILLDDLIKDFLKYDGITFKKIIKPEKMSQEAFDALFSTTTGKEGMITKFRDGYIDGNYIIVGASDLLFDKSLFENGLVGETDLIAINEDGDFEIIDVKALGFNSWSAFDADISLENLIEKLKSEGLSEEEISKNNDVVKLKYTVTNISQKLYYRIQQSIYANLFYNMTGIMPKRLSLFPIEVEVSNEGDIISAKMSSLLKQDFELADDELSKNSIKTLELEYVEESQRIVPLVKPNFADETFTDDKEEKPLIEEIDKSDLLKDNLNTKVAFSGQIGTLELINGNYVVNFGDTIQDLEYNQKPVTNGNLEFSLVGITPIRKIEKIGQIRKINGQRIEAKILGFNNAIINGVNYKLNRNENGEIVSMTYNSNDQEISELEEEKQYYQSEIDRLKSLPQTTQPTTAPVADIEAQKADIEKRNQEQSITQEQVTDLMTYDSGKGTILEQAKRLIANYNRIFDVNAEVTGFNNRRLDIKIGNYTTSISAEALRLAGNQEIFTIDKEGILELIDAKYNAKLAALETSVSDIEAKRADIERRRQEALKPKSEENPDGYEEGERIEERDGKRDFFKYYSYFYEHPINEDDFESIESSNLNELLNKINTKYDAELAALKTPVSDIEGFKNFVSIQPTENRVEPESINSENFIIRETANYRNQINRINKQIENLIKNNPKRTMRGGNFNDFIFALNSLPESFKLIKGKTKSDEELHLKEIEKLSVNPRVAIEIEQIFNTNYPEKLDILLEEGVSKITEDDLSEIYKWANNVLFELTILGSRLTIQNQLADDVDNQMNAMYELLNDLELIKLTKNGKIDRRSTKTSEKVFGPNKVQDRSSLSKDEEPISGQTKGVSGKNQQKKPTIDELKNIIGSSLISDDELLEGLLTEQTIEVTTDAQKLIDKMKNAKSLDDLSNAYLKALEYLNNNPTKINPTEIESINSEKTKELTVEPEFENLENNTYLLPKTAIFGHSRISPVIFKKKNNGTFFIEDVISGNKQDIKENELENFVRMTPEAIEELNNKVQLTEEEKEEFNKNLVAATEVLKNSTALDGVASQVEGGANTGGFLSALTNKNCNI